MTIADMIQVLQAAERGEEILDHTLVKDGVPYDVAAILRSMKLTFKPKPRMVPLEPSDVPPGSAIKWIVGVVSYRTILEVSNEGVVVVMGCGTDYISWERLQRECLISRDGGRTWSRCEKPESV